MVYIKVEEFEGKYIHLGMVTENVQETWKIFDVLQDERQKKARKLDPRFIVHVQTADVLVVDNLRAWEGHLSGSYHPNYAKYIYASVTCKGEWQVLVLRPNGETDWVQATTAMKDDPVGLRDFVFQEELYKYSSFWYWAREKPTPPKRFTFWVDARAVVRFKKLRAKLRTKVVKKCFDLVKNEKTKNLVS